MAKKHTPEKTPAQVERSVEHIQYHRDGSIWAKGNMLDDQQTGYWEWFRSDGTKMRSGAFEKGLQVGEWTTYDKNGAVYKVTVFNKRQTS